MKIIQNRAWLYTIVVLIALFGGFIMDQVGTGLVIAALAIILVELTISLAVTVRYIYEYYREIKASVEEWRDEQERIHRR